MKVRISYSVDVSDDMRREINAHYGQDGLANRDEIKQWYRTFGESMNDELGMRADDRVDEGLP